MKLLIEVPAGELIDKIVILEIKEQQIEDPDKLAHIREELGQLRSVRDAQIRSSERLDKLVVNLQEANLSLWRVEDELRECERRKDFGPGFVRLARSVYLLNDQRAAIKRRINQLTDSRLVEEKSYADYRAA